MSTKIVPSDGALIRQNDLPAGEAGIKPGDVIYAKLVGSEVQAFRAINTSLAAGTALGVVTSIAGASMNKESSVIGDTITFVTDGPVTGYDGSRALTAASPYYVGATAGGLRSTAPGSGEFSSLVGIALSATELHVRISAPITGS